MRNIISLLLLMGIGMTWAQVPVSPWQSLTASLPSFSVSPEMPEEGHVFILDEALIRSQLIQAPSEQTAGLSPTQVEIPLPDGSTEVFRIVNAPIMHSSLENRYDLHTFSGRGTQNGSYRVRISLTTKGLHAMIFTPEGVCYVDPLNRSGQVNSYLSYWRTDLPTPTAFGACATDEIARASASTHTRVGSLGPELYVYRLALSATAAYTAFHGGTLADGMAAITVALTRINGIFENELGIRLELIPNNDQLIFVGTDSYTDNDLFLNLGENQQVIDGIIGTANYDVGHVFTQIDPGPGGAFTAGVAFPGVVCNAGLKAQGASSLPSPIGDGFYLVAAHELGHQFSAGHTWNANSGSCTGNQYSPSTAWEPGSGSTIMAYPGVCGNHNITSIRDGYFHGGTVEQIFDFSRNGNGSACPQIIQTGNQPPAIQLPEDDKTIPYGTAFVLEGSATDANGDSMSYCWEQFDLGPAGDPNVPIGNAPLFRSFLPRENGVRYFPNLASITNGFVQAGERLPDYERDMQFRLTVRDNRAGGGGVSWDEVSYAVTTQAGPFVVTQPNLASEVWRVGQRRTVKWDVALTHLPPVNVKEVRILLSTDGGQTYPTELVAATPNDGEAQILVPDEVSANCRIMVRAADNIFLDISNESFSIEPSTQTDISLYLETESLAFCAGDTLEIPVRVSPQGGLSGEVRVIAGSLPNGVEAIVRVDTVPVGDVATLILTTPPTFTGLSTTLQLVGAAPGVSDILSVPLQISAMDQVSPTLIAPLSGQKGVSRTPYLNWAAAAGATSYTLEISSNPNFQSVAVIAEGITDTSWRVSQSLARLSTFYWRVKAENSCENAAFSKVFAFQTGDCRILSNQDGPFEFSTFGTPSVIESHIQLGAFGTLTDLNLLDIQAVHAEVDDLRFRLVSPDGSSALLLDGSCSEDNQNVRIAFDNESDLGAAPCPPTDGRAYVPLEPLDVFYGQSTLGTWRMQVTDLEDFDAGTFYGWKMEFCTELPEGPELITNDPLLMPVGSLRTIRDTLLEAIDGSFGPADVTFTLVSSPQEGEVQLYGQPLQPGQTFTQRDINLGGLLYQHIGNSDGADEFQFDIRNPDAGWVGLYSFRIDRTVGISSQPEQSLKAYPIPAATSVRIETEQPFQAAQTLNLFDVQGRLQARVLWPAGQSSIQLDVSQLPAGMYLLSSSGSNLSVKIWVAR